MHRTVYFICTLIGDTIALASGLAVAILVSGFWQVAAHVAASGSREYMHHEEC